MANKIMRDGGWYILDVPVSRCGCGLLLYPLFGPDQKRKGVQHLTNEDENEHNEYWCGLRVLVLDKDETELLKSN